MTIPLIFRRIALAEYDDAHRFYSSKSPGAARRFIRAVDKVLDRIQSDPLRYPLADTDVREAMLTKFPFCLYYVVESNRIEIISVFHTSRDPQIWLDRR